MTKDTTSKLKVKEDSVVVEYGETIKLESKEYVDTKGIENKEEFLKKVKIESDIENEEGKGYPGIGIYEVSLKYEKQSVKVKIEVKDTTIPVFNETNEIKFEEGQEFDYASVVTATDLQEVEVTFNTSNVNKDIAGEYTVKAVAKDKSGNKADKDIKVIVTEKSIAEETPAKNTGGANSGTGTVNKPNSSNGSSSKPSTGGTSGSNTDGVVTPPLQPEASHTHTRNNEVWKNYWFDNERQAENAGENFLMSDENFNLGSEKGYLRYGLVYCPCGKVGVIFLR